jgi:hypothetical protein
MRLALLAVTTITLVGTGNAHAGNAGILIPPAEVDFGVGVPLGDSAEGLSPSAEILAGLHWASLAWKPTRVDFGVGYVGSFRSIDDPMRLDDQAITMHGGYVSLGTTVARGKHWLTWFTARGELMRANDNHHDFSVLGSALRVATEIYGSGAAGGRNGFLVGTFALGIYVEATYRDVPAAYGPHGLSSGVTCRLPFLVAGG